MTLKLFATFEGENVSSCGRAQSSQFCPHGKGSSRVAAFKKEY